MNFKMSISIRGLGAQKNDHPKNRGQSPSPEPLKTHIFFPSHCRSWLIRFPRVNSSPKTSLVQNRSRIIYQYILHEFSLWDSICWWWNPHWITNQQLGISIGSYHINHVYMVFPHDILMVFPYLWVTTTNQATFFMAHLRVGSPGSGRVTQKARWMV